MIRLTIFSVVFSLFLGSCQLAQAQGLLHPVRSFTSELDKQKSEYPGPTTYSPSDPWTKSKRFQKQTGHHGLFYNCDNEECKRNSPYICWNSQHRADWRNGWCNALRKDRCDMRQRLRDSTCLGCKDPCSCGNCETGTPINGVVEPDSTYFYSSSDADKKSKSKFGIQNLLVDSPLNLTNQRTFQPKFQRSSSITRNNASMEKEAKVSAKRLLPKFQKASFQKNNNNSTPQQQAKTSTQRLVINAATVRDQSVESTASHTNAASSSFLKRR